VSTPTPRFPIKRAAVLGAGTMGRAIAAHLANAGIPSLLLDIPPREGGDSDALAKAGLKQALKDRPAAFFDNSTASLIEVGNFDDDMARIADCDWIVEAVVERLDIKRLVFANVAKHRADHAIVTSNTSGIPLADILAGEGLDDGFKKNFFITHFFNPVRYMRLLEVVPGPDTDTGVLAAFSDFAQRRLGKGVVQGKDTPNFIANRIGVFGFFAAVRAMLELGLDPTTMDAVVGQPMARPKSGAFRLSDIVGLDVLLHVASNTFSGCPDDEARDLFDPPGVLKRMVEEGMLGAKTGKGFYKKSRDEAGKRVILQLDLDSFEYVPKPKVRFESTGKARKIDDPGARIKHMVNADDAAGRLAWRLMSEALCYSARRVPEIADDIVAVDEALKLGFNWELGPFEAWDAIGLRESLDRMSKDGVDLPDLAVQAAEAGGFYRTDDAGTTTWFDQASGRRSERVRPEGFVVLDDLRAAGKVVKKNLGATLFDLGDGALGLEFHTKMNAVDDDIIKMLGEGVDLAERDFAALVIANDADNFSAGANLGLIAMAAMAKQWDQIEAITSGFQQANQRLRYSAIPVVAAPTGLALGGGCEMAVGADRMRAHAELYMGLVEVGMGLVPGGGGCKELLRRLLSGIPEGAAVDTFPFVRKAFEQIGMAKVATSADEARSMGFLTDVDSISLNRGRLLHDAKWDALGMAATGYRPPRPATLNLPGAGGKATLMVGLDEWKRTGVITEFEGLVGGHLATILTGGDASPGHPVSEQHILDLEREAFLSLCGEAKTIERIQHFLMKGKPLRN
jgi:3-hydroxyacyl-CoA dehydrogenase